MIVECAEEIGTLDDDDRVSTLDTDPGDRDVAGSGLSRFGGHS